MFNTMPLSAGRYRIQNVQWKNSIVLLDGSERSELLAHVPGLEDEQHADEVVILYLIKINLTCLAFSGLLHPCRMTDSKFGMLCLGLI